MTNPGWELDRLLHLVGGINHASKQALGGDYQMKTTMKHICHDAGEALTLLRQMRENAVEVGVDAEMGPAGFEKPDVYFLARTFNKEEDVRALLLLTPDNR